ncbi:MAG TPA: tetratricopeptide repeat-containing glycosyltransferase family protein [Rhodocyclaceae bacterium]
MIDSPRLTLRDALERIGSLLREGRSEEGAALAAKFLAASPNRADALNNLGVVFKRAGKFDEALHCYRQALTLEPRRPGTLSNLALVLKERGHLAEAEACCLKALTLDPQSVAAQYNLGVILKGLGEAEAARTAFRATLALAPQHADARFDLALMDLMLGDLHAGWAGYEARFDPALENPQRIAPPTLPVPRWDGTIRPGLRLLLVNEQGFGDQIQFSRYAPLLAAQGLRVTLVVKPELRRLMGTLAGVEQVLSSADKIDWSAQDAWSPLLSVPGMLGTTLESIPAAIPYLQADAAARLRWRQRLDTTAQGRRRIGLVWGGSPTHRRDQERSIPLAQWTALAEVPNACFFALQKGPRAADAAPAGVEIHALGEELDDFAETAAILSELDLLVSVDTSTVHLAGALGRPAVALLSYVPDWRWLLARGDTPWYPSLSLLRQQRRNDWSAPMATLAQLLNR